MTDTSDNAVRSSNERLAAQCDEYASWITVPLAACDVLRQAAKTLRDSHETCEGRTNQGDSDCVMPGDRLEPTREHLQKLVMRTAGHWLSLQLTHPIQWEGAIDAAMEAACNEIRRLSTSEKASEQPKDQPK